MIGYSLSLCIRDIITDKVNILDVDLILASTCAQTEADWVELTRSYLDHYWRANPPRARRALRYLRSQGKIYQHRVYDKPAPPRPADGSIWS